MFMTKFYRYLGFVYIPQYLKELDEDIILHISDTTTNFFQDVKKLVTVLKPKYIVHTGDLVDNIKLQFLSASEGRYALRVKTLLEIMEGSSAEKIFISMGNHDSINALKGLCTKCVITEDMDTIEIEGIKIAISHYPKRIMEYEGDAKHFMFGHSLELKTQMIDDKVYLNGISSINIMTIKSRQIYKLPYPCVVDDWRMKRGKLGL